MSFERYKKQVDLLLDVLPFVARQRVFGLKGGTAINLFHLPFPRLSVDIDLCYLPIEGRDQSMRGMHAALTQIKTEIKKSLKCIVTPTKPLDGKSEAKLIVSRDGTEVKIEPNYIIRGSLYPVEDIYASSAVADLFNKVVQAPCLSADDLYGGKICAALDRQHPRDLFDMLVFFRHQSIDGNLRDAFVYYLISHNRPFHELLSPKDKPLKSMFETEFIGMTSEIVKLDELLQTRITLKNKVLSSFDDQSRKFIYSVARGKPSWDLYAHPKICDYPSVLWRMHNIQKMDEKKRASQALALEHLFSSF